MSAVGLVETAAPFEWAAIRTGANRVALEGSRPVEIGRRVLEARVTGALSPGTSLDDSARPPAARRRTSRARRRSWRRGSPGSPRADGRRSATRCSACRARPWTSRPTRRCGPPCPIRRRGSASGGSRSSRPSWRSTGSPWRRRPAASCSTATPLRGGPRDGPARRHRGRRGGTVDDRLLAARGLDPAVDPKSLIDFAFRLAELIQSGSVAFTDGAISVTGDAIDGQAIPDAEALMRDARPAGVKAGTVALTARPLSPYRVTIRRTADAVTLTGHLPDAGTRERVLDALRPRLFREPIIDHTRLAEGAPPDLAAALAAAAPLVTSLASGEVAVSDRALTLTGESLYGETAARAPERLAEALPPGWTGQAAVSARQPPERHDPETCRADFAAAVAGRICASRRAARY
ncbi:hypothetical protein ACU4GR_17225 [Methylobacterium oryzae CBMB20]